MPHMNELCELNTEAVVLLLELVSVVKHGLEIDPFFLLFCQCISLPLLPLCSPQNLRGSRHCTVRPPAAGWRAVIATRIGRVPFIVWSLYLCVQADIQHLWGAAGPSTLRPAQGRSCRLEKGTHAASWSGFLWCACCTLWFTFPLRIWTVKGKTGGGNKYFLGDVSPLNQRLKPCLFSDMHPRTFNGICNFNQKMAAQSFMQPNQ